MYDREKEQQVSKIKSFALTTDIWSSWAWANHAYTGLTLHYITTEYELESKVLETKEFSNSHTGRNIADKLQEILSEWNLVPTMLSGITTDNGSNIVLATSILDWPRIACFSHMLQLAIEAATGLPQLSRALGRCRRLVGHLYNSCYILKKKQVDLQHKDPVTNSRYTDKMEFNIFHGRKDHKSATATLRCLIGAKKR